MPFEPMAIPSNPPTGACTRPEEDGALELMQAEINGLHQSVARHGGPFPVPEAVCVHAGDHRRLNRKWGFPLLG